MANNLSKAKRGTKLTLAHPGYNRGVPFTVSYHKKVRNSPDLIQVTFPFEVNGGGSYQVSRNYLTMTEGK